MIDYDSIIKRVESGESLTNISKDLKICRQNMHRRLKNKFEDYNDRVYGKIIAHNKGFDIRKIPNGQTNRCEANITKEAKRLLIERYGGLEECGIWINNYKTRYVIDIFNPENNLGIEICWKSKTYKQIFKRLKNYELFCDDIICVFVKDSTIRKKNKSYPLLRERLIRNGFRIGVLDINNPYTQ